MVHARLGIAEENSDKLVSLIRKEARGFAEIQGYDTIITDGPPGIGCPVIASLSGAECCVIVVEPTLSGRHDAERVIKLINHFGIRAMLMVNRYDINMALTEVIEQLAHDQGLVVLPRIPFDSSFTHAMVAGLTLPEYNRGSLCVKILEQSWEIISKNSDKPAGSTLTLSNIV